MFALKGAADDSTRARACVCTSVKKQQAPSVGLDAGGQNSGGGASDPAVGEPPQFRLLFSHQKEGRRKDSCYLTELKLST